jgi:hypothetical protein
MFAQRRRRRAAAVSIAFAASLSLFVGCAPDQPQNMSPISTPSNEAAVFDSDVEALQAASSTYEQYFAASDAIAAAGGVDPDPIAEFVTPEFLAESVQGFETLAANGLRTTGATVSRNMVLQQSTTADDKARVVTYVCVDVTDVIVRDHTGTDVTPIGRPNLLSLVAEFESSPEDPTRLLLSKNEPWAGDSFC